MSAQVIDMAMVRNEIADRNLKRIVRLALLTEHRPEIRECYESILVGDYPAAKSVLENPGPATPSFWHRVWRNITTAV